MENDPNIQEKGSSVDLTETAAEGRAEETANLN